MSLFSEWGVEFSERHQGAWQSQQQWKTEGLDWTRQLI